MKRLRQWKEEIAMERTEDKVQVQMRLESTVREIEELKDSFVNELHPWRVYLFGSFAEGRETEESDCDFYIVVDDLETDMIALTRRAYRAIRDKQFRPVDIIVNTEKTFNERKVKAYSLESDVTGKGVLLYEARTERRLLT